MLISPIMMTPQYRTPKQLQEAYLTNFNDMAARRGPLVSNRERTNTRVPVSKADFAQRSILMSAPIIFQTRARRTTDCGFNYSTTFLQNMHAKAMEDECDGSTYTCEDSVVANTVSIMACMGEVEENATFFGLKPTLFNGDIGYAGEGMCASVTASPGVRMCVRAHARACACACVTYGCQHACVCVHNGKLGAGIHMYLIACTRAHSLSMVHDHRLPGLPCGQHVSISRWNCFDRYLYQQRDANCGGGLCLLHAWRWSYHGAHRQG